MSTILIRITPATALYLVKDLVKTWQQSGEIYPRVRTYLLYMIFLANSMKRDWKSVDGEFTIACVLRAPTEIADRVQGTRYVCEVAYYRDGLKVPDVFRFPANQTYAKQIYECYIANRNRRMNVPIKLVASDNTVELADIDKLVEANYGA